MANSDYFLNFNTNEIKINFNVVIINMPKSKYQDYDDDITLKLLSNFVYQIYKKLKTKKNYILAHSLGAPVVLDFAEKVDVERYFFLAPFHPGIIHYPSYRLLSAFLKSKMSNFLTKLTPSINIVDEIDLGFFRKAYENYSLIFRDNIFDSDYIKKLDRQFRDNADISFYIVGERDLIISDKHFSDYVDTLMDQKLYKIGHGHNPFKLDYLKIIKLLNKEIKFKRRIFPLSILKDAKKNPR